MRSFRVLPTIKSSVNVLSLAQKTKMMDQKIVVVPSESINFPLSVSETAWGKENIFDPVRIEPTTSRFNRPLLYRVSYEARREEVVCDTGSNCNKCMQTHICPYHYHIITHELLPSGLVAHSVAQLWSNPEIHFVASFGFPLQGPRGGWYDFVIQHKKTDCFVVFCLWE